MVAHQNKLVAQQNEMLREQAASKEREEKMLVDLEAAKERDQELHRMQQQTIDRLVIAQQRVDAILVQNYELHEYPIPRLFVILPDSYEKLWIGNEPWHHLRSARHHTPDTPLSPIRVRNRIHLANHEGYELSRPTEFFDRYGSYVLGMLKILKHCLAVATVVAPVVALVDGGVKDVMGGIKSISLSTMKAVDMSISFLEKQLDDGDASDGFSGTGSDRQDTDDMFESLAALEGADLRRLDTFLRNNDKDKILGNLYRITTDQGHVKWVCFHHYKETYRDTAMASFVQSVEVAGGTYDPHFRRVTISLTSSTVAKDFFKRLARQGPEVDNLDVTLAWDFGSADLVNLVNMVAKSKVKSITLDLQDDPTSKSALASFRPGKGRYHSLLNLFTNKNIRRLQLSNLHQLGTRTSNLPSSVVAPWMQSFHFHGQVNDEGRDRLTNILSRCPSLVDLCLTGSLSEGNMMDPSLHLQIFALKKLQRLHVTGWYRNWPEIPEANIWKDGMSLQELVCTMGALDHSFVEESIRRSHGILEVLVLFDFYFDYTPVDLTPKTNGESSDRCYFPRLTHLDLQAGLTCESREFLLTVLPRLNLVYFGCRADAGSLLRRINLASLKSLSVDEMLSTNFRLLKEAIQGLGGECQIESLDVDGIDYFYEDLSDIIKMLRLKRLSLSRASASAMVYLFRRLNLPSLQTISLYGSEYLPEAEYALAQRRKEESVDAWAWKGYMPKDGGELIYILGQFLTGPSLLASLQLNKHWHRSLLPILWASISKSQWHHPAFPIQQLSKSFKGDDLPASLSFVRELEWLCNVAHKEPLFSYASSTVDDTPWPFSSTGSQLSEQVLTRILEATPNLTTLSLTFKYPEPQVKLVDAIRQLRNLRCLSMDIAMPSTGPVLLDNFYPIFSQLEELSIAGNWYHYTAPQVSSTPSSTTTVPDSTTTSTAPGLDQPWRVRKLRTSVETLSMLHKCPHLVSLALEHVPGSITNRPYSLRHILMCPNIQELSITWWTGCDEVKDLVETLLSLTHLRTLEYCVSRLEHFQFLVPLLPHQRQPPPALCQMHDEDEEYRRLPLAVPTLEHINIKNIYVGSQEEEFERLVPEILKTRPLLKSFILPSYPINPRTFFPQPGKETDDKWACTELEKLAFRLPWTIQSESEEQTRQEVWRPMYRQLGKMKSLKSLTIWGKLIDRSPEAGISQLAGAVGLERLAVKDAHSWVTDREGVMSLIRVLGPKVNLLHFTRLRPSDLELLRECLQEAGRSDIELRETMI
ncbi:hypothetical protein EC957_010595 [Mortierella hygrophila]|uniref:Uncharacterized protein n=1 Tax=Mortierella hygrophila TaxID=979708 RepID=A0A9P6F9R1_9FUNG|nr:hypothetical protein EC957_010595 [Mortierella hygrophila]